MSPSRRRASARCAALQSAHFLCPVAVRTPATAPLPAPHAHASRPCRAPLSRALAPPRSCPVVARTPPYPVAVGRDVPIAPPRLGAVRGLGSRPLSSPYRHYTRALPVRRDRDIAPYRHYARKIRPVPHARSRCAGHLPYAPVAVGRDALPPCPTAARRRVASPVAARHRGAWLGIVRPLAAPSSCPVVRSRCGRARCPHRAAALWRGARLGNPLARSRLAPPRHCPRRHAPRWRGLASSTR